MGDIKEMRHMRITIAILLVCLVFVGGCYNEVSYTPAGGSYGYGVGGVGGGKEIAGYSVEGRPIEYYTMGQGREVVMIISTIHGNESAGTPLVNRMMEYLKSDSKKLAGKQLVVVPVANPDGYAASTRANINGIDLNRNFPAGNRVNNSVNGNDGLTEPESRALYNLINRYRPARIVSIHQPLACIDYDGPAGWLAEKMGRYCDLPVKKLGSRPGSLGSWAGVEMSIPIVTLELFRSDSNLGTAVLWEKYGQALMSVL